MFDQSPTYIRGHPRRGPRCGMSADFEFWSARIRVRGPPSGRAVNESLPFLAQLQTLNLSCKFVLFFKTFISLGLYIGKIMIIRV